MENKETKDKLLLLLTEDNQEQKVPLHGRRIWLQVYETGHRQTGWFYIGAPL